MTKGGPQTTGTNLFNGTDGPTDGRTDGKSLKVRAEEAEQKVYEE